MLKKTVCKLKETNKISIHSLSCLFLFCFWPHKILKNCFVEFEILKVDCLNSEFLRFG